MSNDLQPATYSVDEAAQRLGIGRNSCYDAVRRGDIPSIRIGKRLLVPRIPFERLLNGEGAASAKEEASA